MFHLIHGECVEYEGNTFIQNESFGVQVQYKESKQKDSSGLFFLHPILDEHNKSIKYYAFDTINQKNTFLTLLKIQGIGPKVGFEISHIPKEQIIQAVEEFDTAFFQAIPGIGPKTAKKILIQLKSSFSKEDLIKINADEKMIKNITKTLSSMGYKNEKIKKALGKYTEKITTDNLSRVLQWLITELK